MLRDRYETFCMEETAEWELWDLTTFRNDAIIGEDLILVEKGYLQNHIILFTTYERFQEDQEYVHQIYSLCDSFQLPYELEVERVSVDNPMDIASNLDRLEALVDEEIQHFEETF